MLKKSCDIAIIGGGAAGLIAAIRAATRGCKVILLEKGYKCGRKISITGKGRCNITNTRSWDEFLHHIHPNNQWFKNSFYHFSNRDTISFFESIGVPVIKERGDRVFPESGRAWDVVDALIKQAEVFGVEVVLSADVTSLYREESCFSIEVNRDICISATSVIVATGGLSYPQTGSTGDGYRFAQNFGHTVSKCLPSLTALKPVSYHPDLTGILLKNVTLDLYVDGDLIRSEFGELQFTSGGIEGALGFRLSRQAVRALDNGSKVELILDMKPAVSLQELTERVKREVLPLNKLLSKYMPSDLIAPFIEMNKDLTLHNLPSRLKSWRFPILSYVGYERCVITSGGVSLKEVSRKSMESKLVQGLYFAGEVLDLDGDTGGYNLQIAFSTGALAGDSAASYTSKITGSQSR